jgi:hypothetical protein
MKREAHQMTMAFELPEIGSTEQRQAARINAEAETQGDRGRRTGSFVRASRLASVLVISTGIAMAACSVLGQAHAQGMQAQSGGSGKAADRCEQPLPKGGSGDGRHGEANAQAEGDLSKKLGDCGGVLKAPGVDDGGMVTPAPDTGRERVIKPGMLPSDTNKSNGTRG